MRFRSRALRRFVLCLLGAAAWAISAAGQPGPAETPLALELDPAARHDLAVAFPVTGLLELTTTGPDPWIATRPFPQPAGPRTVLVFDYIAVAAVPDFSVYVGTPWHESRVQAAAELPPRETWSTFALDLAPAWERATEPPARLRLDFGRTAGHLLQVRNVRLRAPDPGEQERTAARRLRANADLVLAAEYQAYLTRAFPAALTRVAVTADRIELAGRAPAAADLFLAESPVWETVTRQRRFRRAAPLAPAADGNFTVSLPRREGPADRLFSRWLVVRAGPERDELLSAARYADSVVARHNWPEQRARSKKGLGGFTAGRRFAAADLADLGIDSVTVNLFLARYLRAAAGPATLPFTYQDRTYHIDRDELAKLDRTLALAAGRDALVFGILLVPPATAWDGDLGARFQHPDFDPAGTYSMANVTDAAGVGAYLALLDFLAARYSLPGAPHGRIHHWIVHNEVDAGWVWTNCGEKPPLVFMDQYHKSMRLAHLVARQYDPHARAYISLTHHWTTTASHRFTPGRQVLENLLAYSRTEGDFDWGLAHHPYPESLREPKTWRDRRVDFTFDTPLITFRNLEVLDAWVREPAQRFLGQHVRSVHLTEQGPNSPDYSPQALQEQAAALAYVWQKVRRLDAIEGFQYHNWVDHREEGGLRIGLRRFPDDPDDPAGRKPVWHVYRTLDTPEEDAATAFALPLIGIKDWAEVHHPGAPAAAPR